MKLLDSHIESLNMNTKMKMKFLLRLAPKHGFTVAVAALFGLISTSQAQEQEPLASTFENATGHPSNVGLSKRDGSRNEAVNPYELTVGTAVSFDPLPPSNNFRYGASFGSYALSSTSRKTTEDSFTSFFSRFPYHWVEPSTIDVGTSIDDAVNAPSGPTLPPFPPMPMLSIDERLGGDGPAANITVVPEPSIVALLSIGTAFGALYISRRRRANG